VWTRFNVQFEEGRLPGTLVCEVHLHDLIVAIRPAQRLGGAEALEVARERFDVALGGRRRLQLLRRAP